MLLQDIRCTAHETFLMKLFSYVKKTKNFSRVIIFDQNAMQKETSYSAKHFKSKQMDG